MKRFIFLAVMAVVTFSLIALAAENPAQKTLVLDFENVPVGKLPSGWKVQATNPRDVLAVWQVTEDSTAPSGNRVLALIDASHSFGSTFNLCWTDAVTFLDGELSVRFKANSGQEDQGGGLIWRVKDRNNYYIARYNPLEDNFRIYYVKNGLRRMLASARLHLAAHVWHSMKITVHGQQFEGYLNGKKLLSVTSDVFNEAGGVGLWTKADAATSFDDFKVVIQKP